MITPPRIALIHATRVSIEPIETAFKNLWPEAETVTLLEEGLSQDRALGRQSLEALNDRILHLARYAESMGPDGILFTCSAFGRGIENAAADSDIPVLKPNEAMFEAAFDHGTDIAMIYTFAPAAAGMEREFVQEAAQRRPDATIRSIYAEGAMDALRAGDTGMHDHLVAQAVQSIGRADAILLAQFSMARAADEVRALTDVPVLTSPEAAIRKMQKTLANSAT